MSIQSIKKIHTLHGRRVLIRVDFNVPLTDNLIQDDIRLRASLPTIKYLIQEGAKVILVTHLGRPEGKVVSLLSVDPIAIRLSELLRRHVQKVDSGGWGDTEYKNVQKAVEGMKSGDVVLLDNIRFSPEEEKNTVAFAKRLADLADLFVLDGFSVAHRAAASVSGVAALLPSYAGLLLEKELDGLSRVTKRPKKPFTLVLGGAKMETKIPVMDVLLPKATHVLIGGGIANTYLAAAGYGVGDSLVDDGQKDTALMFCKKKNVVLPVDVIVGTMDGTKYRHVTLEKQPHVVCQTGEAILDIGPETIRLFATYIKKAKTLLWNGAMGYFEQKPYHHGTCSVARLVATQSRGSAFGVIGGGETLQAMDIVGMSHDVDLVSTGGGAMLEYIGGKPLPGLEALAGKKKRR